jgi:hypothetical protein
MLSSRYFEKSLLQNHGLMFALEGILSDFKGARRLVLSQTLLQRSIGIEVDYAWATPLPEQSWVRSEQKSVSLARS